MSYKEPCGCVADDTHWIKMCQPHRAWSDHTAARWEADRLGIPYTLLPDPDAKPEEPVTEPTKKASVKKPEKKVQAKQSVEEDEGSVLRFCA